MKQAELVQQVVEAAVEVREVLGPGLKIETYADCLCHEMDDRKIDYSRNLSFPVLYKNRSTDDTIDVDILIDDRIVVDVIRDQQLNSESSSCVLAKMRHARKETGLLLNFEAGGSVSGLRYLILNT